MFIITLEVNNKFIPTRLVDEFEIMEFLFDSFSILILFSLNSITTSTSEIVTFLAILLNFANHILTKHIFKKKVNLPS